MLVNTYWYDSKWKPKISWNKLILNKGCRCFSGISAGKESTCNAGDTGSNPGLGSTSAEGIGSPLQHSWASLVTQMVKDLSAMWETWVQSLNWEDPWRRAWQPTPLFLLENPHRQSLVGYSPWSHKESDMTKHSTA